jgi:hypothetical protein
MEGMTMNDHHDHEMHMSAVKDPACGMDVDPVTAKFHAERA